MNEKQFFEYVGKKLGLTGLVKGKQPNPSRYTKYDKVLDKSQVKRHELVGDKHNPERGEFPNPETDGGLIPLMLTGTPQDLAIETVATGTGEALGSGTAGAVGGLITSLATGKPKTIKAENATLGYYPQQSIMDDLLGIEKNVKALQDKTIYGDFKVTTPKSRIARTNNLAPFNFDTVKKGVMDLNKKMNLTPEQILSKEALEVAKKKAKNLKATGKQVVWNPELKRPQVITQEEFMGRLGNDYPWFQDNLQSIKGLDGKIIPERIIEDGDFEQWYGMGAGRNVKDKNSKSLLQYMSQQGLMHDLDLATPSGFKGEHFSDAMQIKYDNPGEAMDAIARISRDNPDRYYKVIQTGGGFRIWDLTNDPSSTHGPLAIPKRLKAMKEMGNDEFYRNMTIGNNVKRIQDKASYITNVPTQKELMSEGILDPVLQKSWEKGKGLHSDVRLDEKAVRITGYRDPNFDSGPPMGMQEMFSLGDINNAGAQSYFNYRQNKDIMDRLRNARGLIDPNRPDMGLGVLDSKYLDYTMKSMSPKWQEQLRKNWKLGLISPAVYDNIMQNEQQE